MSQFEQGANIKFCQKLGKSLSETVNMMKQVYGEEALGCSAVFKWHQCFAQGRDSLEDDERSGQKRSELKSINIIATKEQTVTGQVTRQGDA
jgi:hypothetical protein